MITDDEGHTSRGSRVIAHLGSVFLSCQFGQQFTTTFKTLYVPISKIIHADYLKKIHIGYPSFKKI